MELRTIDIITDKVDIKPEDNYRIKVTLMADSDELDNILAAIGDKAIIRYLEENGYEVGTPSKLR